MSGKETNKNGIKYRGIRLYGVLHIRTKRKDTIEFPFCTWYSAKKGNFLVWGASNGNGRAYSGH